MFLEITRKTVAHYFCLSKNIYHEFDFAPKVKHLSFHDFLFWTQWSVSENNVRFLWWNSILTLKKIKKKGSSIFSWFLLFQLSVHIRNNSGQTSRPSPAQMVWNTFWNRIHIQDKTPQDYESNFASSNFIFFSD